MDHAPSMLVPSMSLRQATTRLPIQAPLISTPWRAKWPVPERPPLSRNVIKVWLGTIRAPGLPQELLSAVFERRTL